MAMKRGGNRSLGFSWMWGEAEEQSVNFSEEMPAK